MTFNSSFIWNMSPSKSSSCKCRNGGGAYVIVYLASWGSVLPGLYSDLDLHFFPGYVKYPFVQGCLQLVVSVVWKQRSGGHTVSAISLKQQSFALASGQTGGLSLHCLPTTVFSASRSGLVKPLILVFLDWSASPFEFYLPSYPACTTKATLFPVLSWGT